MQRVLVTGINGFVGQHMARHLVEVGCEVDGVGQQERVARGVADLVHSYHSCDLVKKEQVAGLDLEPYAAVVCLAGLADVARSFDEPVRYGQVNVAVLSNVCQRLIDQELSPRVIAVSTGAVYDDQQPLPLSEQSALTPAGSPYAQSKIAMEAVARRHHENGLPECVVVRPFNHCGPGQGGGFIVPDMYHKILEAVVGGTPMEAGDLLTRRDYTDVRDVVRAYGSLVLAGSDDLNDTVYNVCSGTSHSGEDILTELAKHIPRAGELEVVTDSALIRPDDSRELVGSNERLRQAAGWQPRISFEQTIADFVASKQD